MAYMSVYIHMQVIHRDLKPENILVKSYMEGDVVKNMVKIADFGLAAVSDALHTYVSIKKARRMLPCSYYFADSVC
jgi:serine/threonine protein kinase